MDSSLNAHLGPRQVDSGLGVFTSIANGIQPPIITESSLSSTSTPSFSSSTGSITSTPSTTTSTTSTAPTPPTTSSTSSQTTTSVTTPTITPTPTPTATPIVYTSSDGTSIVYVTSFANSVATSTSAPEKSFFQNKPLEGVVFALVGIVALVIIFVIVTFTFRRRRRRDRLENVIEANTFDPSIIERYGDEENRNKYRLSASSSGHGYGVDNGPQPTYGPRPVPHNDYYSQGYDQQAAAAYRVPLPQSPVYSQDSGVNTGGASLTRKYSDRKPVPPLLPNPVYDPSRSPVLPSHYYMQNQEYEAPPIPQSTSLSTLAGNEATLASLNKFKDVPYTGILKVANH